MSTGACQKCGERGYIMPLHGEKGGPLFCPFCIGQWQGEFGKKMKWRRILMKAMAAYDKAGGKLHKDLDLMRAAVVSKEYGLGFSTVAGFSADHIPNEFPDLTSELLTDTLALVHPDKHPPEWRELAKRVTADLLALKPYTFPAPKPESPPVYKASDGSIESARCATSKPSKPAYPCELCEDTVPMHYCTACMAEWEKRKGEERERENQKRIEWNARRRQRYASAKQWRERQVYNGKKLGITVCSNCAGEFRAKRQDAKYCSAACRQKAYLKRDGKASNAKPLDHKHIARKLASLFGAQPEGAFAVSDLCTRILQVRYPKRKHRAAIIAAGRSLKLGLYRSWKRGGPYLIFNLDSLMSYAVARRKSSGYSSDTEESIRATLAPGGQSHKDIQPGGTWYRHWQMFVAEANGETDTPHYRKLVAEERVVWGLPA